MEVSGQLHAPAALPPEKESPVPTHWIWASEYWYDVEKKILDPPELWALCYPTLSRYIDSR
jgi:hypothetical protein